ncbi:MAG: thiamine biosynthesis protein ThiF [Bacteroidetes bacterium GWC2_33_15]|nr:MAG: thiamine biosynthesis protein ThiF [Bacteroidetes bacterium GWA2_33_15]OFX51653.1 MAG: thiamine biosynthesis protein ThiF [Bacteroidetes bacterium GWC2_33_15]OFX66285.1 MAG: thiamine biosynthesis protein ThiF [Bacteroidetes bacterium GWB2_32_14]OFX66953.1 MAG: thiamine biosynthesis protein ThiF [Bacteroidetes bacterium GWD2_33_33]HAN17648.1 sulfur carrier protein ThiS adenylyltransferase ThiF [Bacteroidales bacterium]
MTFEEIRERLKNFTAGIAGAGGLGSNCAVALARVGIGKLIIADFDIVSESNLNRQYYFRDQVGMKKVEALKENILRINPDVEIEIHDIKLNQSNLSTIYKECHVLVEAFDLAEMKKMLIETCISELPDKPVVVGLGMAGWGDSNSIHLRKSENIYICGDEKSEISEINPPLAPRVAMVANLQANTVLEILIK